MAKILQSSTSACPVAFDTLGFHSIEAISDCVAHPTNNAASAKPPNTTRLILPSPISAIFRSGTC
jgi:hypothetical protein